MLFDYRSSREWVCSSYGKSELLLLITSRIQSRSLAIFASIRAFTPILSMSTAGFIGLESDSHRERSTEAPFHLCSASVGRQSPARLGTTNGEPLRAPESTVTIMRRGSPTHPARCDLGGLDDRTNRLQMAVSSFRGGADAVSGPRPFALYVCNAALLVFPVRPRRRESSAESATNPAFLFAIATLSLLSHRPHWQKGSDLARDSPLK